MHVHECASSHVHGICMACAPRYDKASKVAKKAHKEGSTLIEAGGPDGLGFFTPEQFAATLRQDLRDWGALVKDIGLQPE